MNNKTEIFFEMMDAISNRDRIKFDQITKNYAVNLCFFGKKIISHLAFQCKFEEMFWLLDNYQASLIDALAGLNTRIKIHQLTERLNGHLSACDKKYSLDDNDINLVTELFSFVPASICENIFKAITQIEQKDKNLPEFAWINPNSVIRYFEKIREIYPWDNKSEEILAKLAQRADTQNIQTQIVCHSILNDVSWLRYTLYKRANLKDIYPLIKGLHLGNNEADAIDMFLEQYPALNAQKCETIEDIFQYLNKLSPDEHTMKDYIDLCFEIHRQSESDEYVQRNEALQYYHLKKLVVYGLPVDTYLQKITIDNLTSHKIQAKGYAIAGDLPSLLNEIDYINTKLGANTDELLAKTKEILNEQGHHKLSLRLNKNKRKNQEQLETPQLIAQKQSRYSSGATQGLSIFSNNSRESKKDPEEEIIETSPKKRALLHK